MDKRYYLGLKHKLNCKYTNMLHLGVDVGLCKHELEVCSICDPCECYQYKLSFIFAWYDLWMGFFWDRKHKILYFFPLPTIGVKLEIPIDRS